MRVSLCLVASLACACSVPIAVFAWTRLRRLSRLLETIRRENDLLSCERKNERQGRIRAEKKLRERAMESATDGSAQPTTYPLKPIGFLKSCFSQRNGTPRQPLLVHGARSSLTLRSELSSDFLDGLEKFSHCWILYMFHKNTDFQKVWDPSYFGIKGKIRVPRLNGAKLGVYSTRSPHRPCPIGISVAKIVSIMGKTVIFAGADIVDGSPVLDLKPYVPFCDHVQDASAPNWVNSSIKEDPLTSLDVTITEEAMVDLKESWRKGSDTEMLYESLDKFVGLIKEVLSRDIRSVTQRIKIPGREEHGLVQSRLHDHQPNSGTWHVILHGIDIAYDITKENQAIIRSCHVL